MYNDSDLFAGGFTRRLQCGELEKCCQDAGKMVPQPRFTEAERNYTERHYAEAELLVPKGTKRSRVRTVVHGFIWSELFFGFWFFPIVSNIDGKMRQTPANRHVSGHDIRPAEAPNAVTHAAPVAAPMRPASVRLFPRTNPAIRPA